MRVLLTGGVGYVGGRLAGLLSARARWEVVLGTRTPQRAPAWAQPFRLVRTDWTEEATLAQACAGVDAVIHLAGMNAQACAADPVGALAFNGVGTARLLRIACRERVRRFIYLSSAHVYGSALHDTVDERTCPEPRHPYASSHRAAEDVVRAASHAGEIEGLIVRLSNAYGAPADAGADCWSLLTNELCLQAVRTRRLVLRTSGAQRRDFVALGEACRALAHVLAVPAALCSQPVMNVGGGWAPTVREMATLIAARVAQVLGFRPEVQIADRADPVGSALSEYRIARLLESGFAPDPAAAVTEIDQLIRFCHEQSESLP